MFEAIKFIFSLWLYPTIICILLTVLLINECIRTFLNIFLWLLHRGNVFLVNDGADAVWEYRTNGNTRMVLVCLVTKRGQLDNPKSCAKILDDRVFHTTGKSNGHNSYEKLQNIIIRKYGYTCWKRDKNFQVRRHIRTLDRDFEYTEKDVMNLLSALTRDMDEQKPQWEWVLLPKYVDSKGEKKSLQIFRYHHCYMDGMSGLMLISKLSDNFKYVLDPLNFKTPLWKKIYFYVNCIIFAPLTLFRMYYNKYQTYWNRRRSRSGSRSRHSGIQRRKFMAWTNSVIDLEILRQIRFDTKASIPNIVSFAFVEACKNILPKKRLVKEMRVSEVIAFFPYPNSNPQNRFTAFTYPIELEDNNRSMYERLRITQRNSLAGIGGPEPLVIYFMAKIAGRFSYHILPYLFSGAHSSLHLSNVPCAKESFRFFNAECEEFMAFPPLPNDTGLCISSLSYKGGLKICGQADSSCLSEHELRQILQEIPNVIYSIARCSMPFVDTDSPNSDPGLTSDRETRLASNNNSLRGSYNVLTGNKLSPPKSGMKNTNRKSPSPRRNHKKRPVNIK